MSEQKKGVVLETQPKLVTVLTTQGEFRSVPWTKPPYPEIGSEISFREPAETKKRFGFTRLMALAACLLIVFISVSLWSGILMPGSQQVVAYVTIDINPSIELGLNTKGQVVQALGLNQDGQQLLEKLELESLPADKAVELITQAAMEKNYLQEGKENTIVITVSDPEKVPEKVKKLEQKVSSQLANKQLKGTTQVLEVNGEIHDKAKELGVSPGKYVILLEAVEEGLDLSVDDLKGSSIVKAIKEAGGVPGQIINKAQKEKQDYKDLEKRVSDRLKKIEESRKNKGPKPAEQEKPEPDDKKNADKKGQDKKRNNGSLLEKKAKAEQEAAAGNEKEESSGSTEKLNNSETKKRAD